MYLKLSNGKSRFNIIYIRKKACLFSFDATLCVAFWNNRVHLFDHLLNLGPTYSLCASNSLLQWYVYGNRNGKKSRGKFMSMSCLFFTHINICFCHGYLFSSQLPWLNPIENICFQSIPSTPPKKRCPSRAYLFSRSLHYEFLNKHLKMKSRTLHKEYFTFLPMRKAPLDL